MRVLLSSSCAGEPHAASPTSQGQFASQSAPRISASPIPCLKLNLRLEIVQVVYGNESGWYDGVASGEATAYVQTYPDFSYISGTFHHVRLTGLQPNASYYFKCALAAL